jgi:hypothetical protein
MRLILAEYREKSIFFRFLVLLVDVLELTNECGYLLGVGEFLPLCLNECEGSFESGNSFAPNFYLDFFYFLGYYFLLMWSVGEVYAWVRS